MSVYLPQVLVYQEFNRVPTAMTDPLRACIVGPRFDLFRYGHEKDLIGLGSYDSESDTTYNWPNRGAGTIVDESYTKVLMDDALLNYYGTDTLIDGGAGANELTSDTLNFRTGNGFSRSGVFYDRDVQVGDVAHVAYDGTTVASYITGFGADVIAAIVGAAAPDASNQDDVALDVCDVNYTGVPEVEGDINAIVDCDDYDGLPDGILEESYIVSVAIRSGSPRLDIVSASGTDNVYNVDAVFDEEIALGSRGATITFTLPTATPTATATPTPTPTPSPSVIVIDDFTDGQEWTVDIEQAYTAITAASGGNYTGTVTDNYIVEVTRGGYWADLPQIVVYTTRGLDVSGPTTVTGAGIPVVVGSRGVTITFTGDGLVLGDIYVIPVTPATAGRINTLRLANNLPAAFIGQTVDVQLYIKADIEVTGQRYNTPGVFNWVTSATTITLNSGITALNSTWKDGNTLLPLNVTDGIVYAEYRALNPENATTMNSVSSVTDLEDELGEISPDNPLCYAVYKALQNSNGTEVKYVPLATSTSWSDALDVINNDEYLYSLVPLTEDNSVISLFNTYTRTVSSPEEGRWKLLWASEPSATSDGIYVEDESEDPLLATIDDLVLTSANAEFLTNGIRANDIIRYNYTLDGWGNTEYEEYVIDEVLSENSVRLVDTPGSSAIEKKIEVWRNYTKAEEAANIMAKAGVLSFRRAYLIWPDWVRSDDGNLVNGYYMCAALSGLRSGVAPHQGLTNVEIAGFSEVSRSTDYFTRSQIKAMRDAGVWIVTQADDGTIYTLQQVSTDNTDINTAEQSITTNLDSVSYFMRRSLEGYIGKGNMTDSMLKILGAVVGNNLSFLKMNLTVERLGPQIRDGEVVDIRQHPVLKDRAQIIISLTLPAPLNNIELYLIV